MKKATYENKSQVIKILSDSFADNKSVNYIIKQDKYRLQRIANLIDYSFELCYAFGEVFVSDDGAGCALIIFPDKKKTTLKTIFLDLKLIFSSTGFSNAGKAMRREAEIKSHHPVGNLYYLWFIGVLQNEQNKGTGTGLLKEIFNDAKQHKRTICLETSVERNLPWYHKNGFEIYKELDFGYKLFCMKST